jgi:hypothetical protein
MHPEHSLFFLSNDLLGTIYLQIARVYCNYENVNLATWWARALACLHIKSIIMQQVET